MTGVSGVGARPLHVRPILPLQCPRCCLDIHWNDRVRLAQGVFVHDRCPRLTLTLMPDWLRSRWGIPSRPTP